MNPVREPVMTTDVTKSKLNVYAAEFVPSTSTVSSVRASEQKAIDDSVRECIMELSMNPGEFDEIVDSYINLFLKWLDLSWASDQLAITLTDTCISDNNCRYIGVKLAKLLKGFSSDNYFLQTLLNYCETQYIKLCTSTSMEDKSIPGLVLYIGELYVQLESKLNSRYAVLKDVMISIFEKLLNTQTEESLSLLVKALKLTRHCLKEDDPQKLNFIMILISKIPSESFSSSLRIQLETLLKTHEESWDNDKKDDSNEDTIDPVLYGPDGEEISFEENSFLNKCLEKEIKQEELEDISAELEKL